MIRNVSRALPPRTAPAPRTDVAARTRSARFQPRESTARARPTDSSPPSLPQRFARAIEDIDQQRDAIDRLVERARRGDRFTPAQLLAMQAQVYRYSQKIEVFSRVTDRIVGALKTTLNTQL